MRTNALSGLRFGASVGRISAAHPALIHVGLNRCSLRTKPCCQRFGGAGEQGGVNADGDKQRAQFQIAFCQLLIGDQDPRRFARFADLHDRLLKRGQYFRVLWITGLTHIGAQIRRADKHAVDPFHVQNLR